MSDLIDRQAAINAVNTALFPKINTAKDAEKALLNLPSAQPEQTNSWCINSWCNDCKDDVISRAEAIRVASGYCHPANIADELRKLPSAQPERETGKWVKTKDSEWSGGGCYTCSNCSLGISFELFGLMTDWNFCPNCGERMEGEE